MQRRNVAASWGFASTVARASILSMTALTGRNPKRDTCARYAMRSVSAQQTYHVTTICREDTYPAALFLSRVISSVTVPPNIKWGIPEDVNRKKVTFVALVVVRHITSKIVLLRVNPSKTGERRGLPKKLLVSTIQADNIYLLLIDTICSG